jgi:RNA polymerase sigma-70 factor (ECF subfamily)
VPQPSSDLRFREIFDAHHDAIHRYTLRRLGVDDANEATAEVFLIMWRRLDKMPPGDAALLWLYGAAANVVRNHNRGNRRRLRLAAKLGSLGEPAPPEPEPLVIRHHQQVEVHEALQRLRSEDRELLRLKTWEGLTNRQVGTILGVSDRAVEGRYARALKRLARELPVTSQQTRPSPRSVMRGGER